jgi:hypothetical protein
MKKIFKASVLAFTLAFMLNACAGSDDSIRPVLYEMFGNYTTTTFPAGTPWSSYNRTSGTWTDANWSITNNNSDYGAFLYLTGTQNSVFINPNYNKTDVNCSVSARMSINSPDNSKVQLGVILRATGSGSEHYAFVYLVGALLVPTVEIQKVDAAGTTITVLGTAPIANSSVTPFDPKVLHTYRFSVSGTTTLTFTASIDGVQQLPAITNADGTAVTPASDPITDDGITYGAVYHSGEPGFFVENANTAYVTRFFLWEP